MRNRETTATEQGGTRSLPDYKIEYRETKVGTHKHGKGSTGGETTPRKIYQRVLEFPNEALYDFTKAVSECCWNVTHGRAPLSTHEIQQLKRHKALLRKLSNSSIPIKQRKIAIQRGSGFASLLPLLLGPIVAGISRLIKGQ